MKNLPQSHQSHNHKPFYPTNNLIFLLTFFLLLVPTWVSAQITGRVVDSDNNNLEGVHINALHNGANTVSDADGNFSLELLDDPAGIRRQAFLGGNVASAQGARLQMNLLSGQLEVHLQGDVYDLRGRLLRPLRIAEDAVVYSHGEKGTLRKALAQADTLVFVKAGYVTARIDISEDALDLGDVELQGAIGRLIDARDGQVYATTTIGTQTWMAANLNYESNSGSYCYKNDPAFCITYSRLYTRTAAMGGAASSSTNPSGVQGVCPDGWHLPSDEEWETLAEYVATETGLTGKSGDDWTQIHPKLKSTTGWNNSASGTNDYGFSGLPGGYLFSNGNYYSEGEYACWWSATESSDSTAYARILYSNFEGFFRSSDDKSYGYSVRCIMN